MNISSAPTTYYTTSSSTGFIAQEIVTVLPDTITLDTATMANISTAAGGIENITVSNSTGSSYYYTGNAIGGAGSTITISNGGSGYTIGAGSTIGTSTFNWKTPEEFVDAFPDFGKIKQMCDEYPGLKIAYEKFVTTYKLVKDHYDTPEDQRPKP
jgi:hypothetical protein